MSQPITKAHIKLSMSYAGILSYCTLLVRLVEDITLNHRFDSTDNLTMITSVTAIVVAAVTLLGGQISGTQDAQSENVPNTGDATATPAPTALTAPADAQQVLGSFSTLTPVTISLVPAGPAAQTVAPAAVIANTAPVTTDVSALVAPVAPSVS